MFPKTLLVVLSLSAMLAANALAAERPKVGLVLGGGGARGGAHLGVLEVLEEMRIPVDCVAGTSMGALVGGAFASGVTPAEMRQSIKGTDWTDIFDDGVSRDLQSARRRALDERFFPGLEFGVTAGGLRYREGAVAGEKVKLFFNRLVHADRGERNIEDLPLPLTLIATDIVTGERVPMRRGNLTSAMRGSMSVPGAMAPIVRDGRKLVDGGLVDNLPVEEVRERCGAQVVIAVNVGTPLLGEKDIAGAVSVIAQMVNLLTEQNVLRSKVSMKPTDIYLQPLLGALTAADFDRQLEAAQIGREAALAAATQLKELSVSPEAYAAWRARLERGRLPDRPVVHEIQVDATRFVDPKDLRQGLSQAVGKPLDSARLADDLLAIYSQGDLQSLDYVLLRDRDKTILKLLPIEKSWGPDYLRFGLNLVTDLRAESNFNIRALYRKTWINSRGGEWLLGTQIGSQQALSTEFYQPLDERGLFFVRPQVNWGLTKAPLYFDGNRVAQYRVVKLQPELDVGVNLGSLGQLTVGWSERRSRGYLDTGSPVLPSEKTTTAGITAALSMDQFDYPFFPTRGWRVDANWYDARHAREEGRPFTRAEAAVSAARSIGPVAIVGSLSGGKIDSFDVGLSDIFALGGTQRLSAFAPGQILAREYALATVRGEWRLNRPVPLLGLATIAGATYERARVRGAVTEPLLRNPVDSWGVYFATATTFGPFYFGYSNTKDRRGRWYLFLGTP